MKRYRGVLIFLFVSLLALAGAVWYYHREPFVKKSKGSYSMDKIREMYGSVDYGTGKAGETAAALLTA